MWWLFQVLACLLVTVALTIMRQVGFNINSYFWYCAICILFTGWMFPLSYAKAPGFFQPYFLGNATLALGGCMVSAFYFHEAVSFSKMFGAVLTVVGSFLLII